MNKAERCKAIRAMEYLSRFVYSGENEPHYDKWLMGDPIDGGIGESTTDDDLDWYTKDEHFSALISCFLWGIKNKRLCIDGIIGEGRF